jgi:hypothetical protein
LKDKAERAWKKGWRFFAYLAIVSSLVAIILILLKIKYYGWSAVPALWGLAVITYLSYLTLKW